MKKKSIISIAFIIIFILTFIISSNIYNKSSENEVIIKQLIKKSTDKNVKKEKIIKSKSNKVGTIASSNLLLNVDLNAFYAKQINWDSFTNNITLSRDKVTWWIRDEMKYLHENLFTNNVTYSVTNLFNILVKNSIPTTLNITNTAYLTGLMSLRYCNLLPYVKQIILQANQTTNYISADMYISWLGHIQHPDTLRIILELNKLLTKDSQLRKERRWSMKWTDNLPVFFRDDCLPVYLEITRNPEKYTLTEWRTAHGALLYFTNNIAVTEYKKGIKNIQKVHKNLHPLIIRDMRSRIEYQNDFCTGKKPLIKRPKPLLDE